MDHLIPFSIGGSDSIKNLWLERLRLSVNDRDLGGVTNDMLEERVHWLAVSGQLDLAPRAAQDLFRFGW